METMNPGPIPVGLDYSFAVYRGTTRRLQGRPVKLHRLRDLPGRGMPTLYGSDFAEVYSKYGYNQFSARVAELLPCVLRALHLTPDPALDVPDGAGPFALEVASKCYLNSSVDRSFSVL